MKHNVTTLYTKKALSASLKKLMEIKPLSKITVTDLVTDCGVNRKTFYYHFNEVCELLKWTLEQEAIDVVRQFDLLTEYEDAIHFVLNYIRENKHILNCAYDSIGRDTLKEFLYHDLSGIMLCIIEQIEDLEQVKLDKEFKQFLCDFYTEGVAGKIINLLQEKENICEDTMIQYIAAIFKHSLPNIIKEETRKA